MLQTRNDWVRQHDVDAGVRDGISADERARIKDLVREVKELHKALEIRNLVSVFFGPAGTRLPTQFLRDFVDRNRKAFVVGPIFQSAVNQPV